MKGKTQAQITLLITLTILAMLWACSSIEKQPSPPILITNPTSNEEIGQWGNSNESPKPEIILTPQITFETNASWYGPGYHGKITARGWHSPKGTPYHRERFNQGAMTAAHKSLPFGTILRVTNPKNGKWVIVEVNDRGPYVEDRNLDLSKAAMEQLDGIHEGVIRVIVEVME